MLEVKQRVVSRHSRHRGTIVEVNNKWGWYLVHFDDGAKRYYSSVARDRELSIISIDELEKSQFSLLGCYCPGEECYCPELA